MAGGKVVSLCQDRRYVSTDHRLIKKLPKICDKDIELQNLSISATKAWIAGELISTMGIEDEVVINLAWDMLDAKILVASEVSLRLSPFLKRKTFKFLERLWNFLLAAQQATGGIPEGYLRESKESLLVKEGHNPISETIQRLRHRFQPLKNAP